MAKFEITVDELYTFLSCPLRYKLTHINKIPDESEYKNNVLFSKGIHQVISYFYTEIMQERMPSLKQLRDKWASYYYSIFEEDKKTKENFLLARTAADHKRIQNFLNKGYEIIYAFYNENKDNPGTPIAVSYPFRIAIDKDIVLTGEFELIREVKDEEKQTRFIEVVDFKTSGHKNDSENGFFLRHDIRATIMFFAFEQLFGNKPDRFIFDYVNTNHQLKLRRDNNEFNRLKAILKGIKNSIHNEDFYPRQSFMCKSCPMLTYCDRLKF